MRRSVDYKSFLTWAKEHFDDIKVLPGKIKLNSIFCEHLGGDVKHHLWCRPKFGSFHCYKSGTRGSLYDLVMEVEQCSYDEAVDHLGGDQELRYLEAKLEAFFAVEQKEEREFYKRLKLPPNTYAIHELLPQYKSRVEGYLASRMIPPEGLYYCIQGDYGERIVIPYYDRSGDLVYYNARDISGFSKIRYRGPDGETGAKRNEVVWMSFFPKAGSKVYLTEGEFDAMSLNLSGLHGCATAGKEVDPKQIGVLRGYKICLAFDADPAGKDAFRTTGFNMLQEGIKEVSFVRPPEVYGDWNDMLCALGPQLVAAYIRKNEKPFNEFTTSLLNS